MKTMVFDIETVPDVESGRRILDLEGLPDDEVAKAMTFHRLQETGSDFLPLHLQRIVAISVVWRHRDGLKAMSLGTAESSEQELVTQFFAAIERHTPELVSWNGSGFDLPVLHYRSLLHGIQAPRYWETGDNEQAFRYNNYLGRFHWRHIDLMDVLSGFQGRSRASLNDIATMLGLPGKLGFSGDMVWDYYQRGEIEAIRNYCETDVMNTWLVYVRFQFLRGLFDAQGLDEEHARVRRLLDASDAPHWKAFAAAWAQPGSPASGQPAGGG
ncbi:MAG: 3'-5' exonuclease [Gammaproteobacteria bacterium]